MSSEPDRPPSPWLKVTEAADRARVGRRQVERAAKNKQLRSVQVGGRKERRFLPEWVDEWLLSLGDRE